MSLKSQAVSGVKWTTLSTVVNTLVQIIRLAVLTRLLNKSDFGLIAIALMVISFTEIFSGLGLTVAVIHKQNITDKQYSSVYWMNVFASVIMFIIVCICSPLLANFYSQPILNTIIPLLGIQILLNAFGKMFQTIKAKNLEFNFISKVQILAVITGFIVTVILAIYKFGVFSLVYGQLFQVVLTQTIFALSGIKQQKLLFYFSFGEIKDFVKIGGYQLGGQVLDFISAKIDVFLIGRFFGMDNLGIYNIAKELILKPYQIINSLVSSVASSAFAKIQNDIAAIKRNYSKVVELITAISFPIYVCLFVFAEPIVQVLYAPGFSEVAVFIRILAIWGIGSSINSPCSILQVALGRTDIGFKWTIIRVLVSTITIFIASTYTIYIVAYSQMIIAVIFFFLYWKVAIWPLSKIKLLEYFHIFKQSAIYSIVLGCIFVVILYISNLNLILQIALATLFFILYALSHWIYNRKFVMENIKLIVNK